MLVSKRNTEKMAVCQIRNLLRRNLDEMIKTGVEEDIVETSRILVRAGKQLQQIEADFHGTMIIIEPRHSVCSCPIACPHKYFKASISGHDEFALGATAHEAVGALVMRFRRLLNTDFKFVKDTTAATKRT